MPVEPQTQAILDLLAAAGQPGLSAGTPQSARASFAEFAGAGADPAILAEIDSATDRTLPGPAGPLPIRIYRPRCEVETVPTVIFLHGGGFVIGNIDTHDGQARFLCHHAEAVVVSVDYRLAPEAPFPNPVEDCISAARWAIAQVADLGGDPARIGIAGDSAGGNLAAVVAQQLRDHGLPLAAQLLLYPVIDFAESSDYPSRQASAEGYLLTANDMRWFHEQYIPAGTDLRDPRLSPIHGDLSGLAPAVVATAEFDPLRDEGNAYAAAMMRAGVTVRHHCFSGLIHGFFGMDLASAAAGAAARTATDDFAALLAEAIRPVRPPRP